MIEDDYLWNFDQCFNRIRAWKKWYFRKNSKHNSQIQLRFWHFPEHKQYWKYSLELQVNGKIIEKLNITPEAYKALIYSPDLREHKYTGVIFTILYEFIAPNKNH